jgi:hypothetical protein
MAYRTGDLLAPALSGREALAIAASRGGSQSNPFRTVGDVAAVKQRDHAAASGDPPDTKARTSRAVRRERCEPGCGAENP